MIKWRQTETKRIPVKHLFVTLLFFFGIALAFAPVPAEAASIVPCGRTANDPDTPTLDESKPCTLCHVVLGAQGLMQWGMNIMTVIAITVIFAMGVLYIVSAGNEGMMQTAKKGMWAALIGFAIMLLAWLIVNIVITILADTESGEKPFLNLVKTQGVFSFSCDLNSKVNGQ